MNIYKMATPLKQDPFLLEKKRVLQDKVDISKKGSVDAPIVHLVQYINDQENYYTTSSCSGRILVFSEACLNLQQFIATNTLYIIVYYNVCRHQKKRRKVVIGYLCHMTTSQPLKWYVNTSLVIFLIVTSL